MSRTVGVAVSGASRAMSTSGNKINAGELFVGSDLSKRYAQFRPKLPVEHVNTIVELLGRKPGVWVDVGCGPGTSTQQIVGHADRIIGVDISETQVEVAKQTHQHPSLSFEQGTCDKLPVEDCSVDVVTAVQAAHYFDLPAFFKEVDRVLKPGGIVGLVSINLPACVDSVTMDTARLCMFDLVNQYGSPEKVKLLFENYKNLVVPYPTRKDHMVDIYTTWTLDDYVDVCMTYSTINRMIKRKGLTVEEGRAQYVKMLREGGMTELDAKSVYTWSHLCALVTANKP